MKSISYSHYFNSDYLCHVKLCTSVFIFHFLWINNVICVIKAISRDNKIKLIIEISKSQLHCIGR